MSTDGEVPTYIHSLSTLYAKCLDGGEIVLILHNFIFHLHVVKATNNGKQIFTAKNFLT